MSALYTEEQMSYYLKHKFFGQLLLCKIRSVVKGLPTCQDVISDLSSFRNTADDKVESTNAFANSSLQPTIAQQKQLPSP